MSKRVVAIVGVGPGNGAAFAKRFDREGCRVAVLSRTEGYVKELAGELKDGHGYVCDVSDPASVEEVFGRIRSDAGEVDDLVFNAGSGVWGHIEDVTADAFESSWRINTLGCFLTAKQVIPSMQKKGGGNIVVIGATASLRGGANFTAFASAKAAQRSLAQSMARQLAPQGIHVSLVIIDGVIDLPRTRKMMPDKPDEFFLQPADIADSVYFLTRQNKSAWTFELDLRPHRERW